MPHRLCFHGQDPRPKGALECGARRRFYRPEAISYFPTAEACSDKAARRAIGIHRFTCRPQMHMTLQILCGIARHVGNIC
jgi:hypothetical protein